MVLMISETIKHGKGNGIKIGLAPLVTDFPILMISVFVLSKLESLNILLGIISFFGAAYLVYLAIGNIMIKKIDTKISSKNISVAKGIIANFLNPNPYIFFFSIISPLIIKQMKENILYGPLFVVVFLGVFVVCNTILVLSVHSTKGFFSSKKYLYTIKSLGFVLLFFSLTFFKEGLGYFGLFR